LPCSGPQPTGDTNKRENWVLKKKFTFTFQDLSAKGWSPKGRRGKENTCEATGGI